MITSITKIIINYINLLNISIIIYINSYLLYKYLIKLRIIKEKRLIIDLIVLYQSYK
jgi:hypothetical protein